jgi:hypothetical protein
MAELNLTTVAGIYNRLYPNGIESLILGTSPTLGLVGKDIKVFDGLGGSGKELLWEVNAGTGASGSYAVAYAQPGNETFAKPFVTRGRLFATRQLSHEAWRAAKGNGRALTDLVKQAVKGATYELKHRASSVLTGGLGGSIGRISATSNVSIATITLSDPSECVKFKPNQRLQAFTTVAGGLLNAGAVVTLTAAGVNYDTGVLTATTHWDDSIAAIAAGDYLIPEGDFGTVPVGMDGWNPTTLIAAGAGDNWFGVDRGGSVPMQGTRMVVTAGTIDEAIVQAAARHYSIGGVHDTALCNPLDFATMKQDQFSVIVKNAIGSDKKEIASVSYKGLEIQGPQGPIAAFADPFMKRGRVRLTRMSSWTLWSLGEMFGRMTEGMGSDGVLRLAGQDASYMVFGGYGNFVCERPLDSVIVTLPNAPA